MRHNSGLDFGVGRTRVIENSEFSTEAATPLQRKSPVAGQGSESQ